MSCNEISSTQNNPKQPSGHRAYRDDGKRQHDALQNVEQLVQLVQFVTCLEDHSNDKGGHNSDGASHTRPFPGSHLKVQKPRHDELTCSPVTVDALGLSHVLRSGNQACLS